MQITYENSIIEVEKGTKVIDALKKQIDGSTTEIIACICNNNVRSLDYEVNEDSKIELIDYSNPEGQRIYIRGLLYVMAKASISCKLSIIKCYVL